MKLAILIPSLLSAVVFAQSPSPKQSIPSLKNEACSSDIQASGFTGCEELRLRDVSSRMNLVQIQTQQQMQPLQDEANSYIKKFVGLRPGMQYVTAAMQSNPQAQQQFSQQFPLGKLEPIPKPETPKPVTPTIVRPPTVPTPATSPSPKK